MMKNYFRNLYNDAMHRAYSLAHDAIISSLRQGGKGLDCGAHKGQKYQMLRELANIEPENYFGIEWNQRIVLEAQKKKINIVQGDLNTKINFTDNEFKCVFGLSVLEHLLNPCLFLKECYRVLEKGGSLIILTPNISTLFTALLIIMGKMPSSGPHPDSDLLLKQEELLQVSHMHSKTDAETDTPVHRHLVVFSYRVLQSYLKMIGFIEISGHGFGLYPFPAFMQPTLEKIDPYHCHQMVFIAKK